MFSHVAPHPRRGPQVDAGRLHLTAAQARDRVSVLRELNLRQTRGPSATGTDLATTLNMSQARVDRALAFRPHAPLPDPLHGGEDIADRAPGEQSPTVPIERFVGMLPTRERDLMQLMYGFSGPPHTSAQIAEAMGCSLRTVDRFRHEAQQHLRELLDHFGDAPDTTQSRSNTQRLSAASGLARSGPHATGFGRSTSVRPAGAAHRSPTHLAVGPSHLRHSVSRPVPRLPIRGNTGCRSGGLLLVQSVENPGAGQGGRGMRWAPASVAVGASAAEGTEFLPTTTGAVRKTQWDLGHYLLGRAGSRV